MRTSNRQATDIKRDIEKIKLIQISRNAFLNQLKGLPQRIEKNNECKTARAKGSIEGNRVIDLGIMHSHQLIQQLNKLQEQWICALPQPFLEQVQSAQPDARQYQKCRKTIKELADVEYFIKYNCLQTNEEIDIIDHRYICQYLLKAHPETYRIGPILYMDQHLTSFQRTMHQLKQQVYTDLRANKFTFHLPQKYTLTPPSQSIPIASNCIQNNPLNNVLDNQPLQQQQLSSFFDQPYCHEKPTTSKQATHLQKASKIDCQKQQCIPTENQENKKCKKKKYKCKTIKICKQYTKQQSNKVAEPYHYEIQNVNYENEYFQQNIQQKEKKIKHLQSKHQIKLNKRNSKLNRKTNNAKQQKGQKYGVQNINQIKFLEQIKMKTKRRNKNTQKVQSDDDLSQEQDELLTLKKEKLRIFKFQGRNEKRVSCYKINSDLDRWKTKK